MVEINTVKDNGVTLATTVIRTREFVLVAEVSLKEDDLLR